MGNISPLYSIVEEREHEIIQFQVQAEIRPLLRIC